MPGFSWNDLKKSSGPTSNEVAPSPVRSIEEAVQHSPMLTKLLEQREKLEAEMQSLSQGRNTQTSSRETRIYPVQTLQQRRAEIQQWEAEKDRHKNRLKDLQKDNPIERLKNVQTSVTDRLANRSSSSSSDNTPPLRKLLSDQFDDHPIKQRLSRDIEPPLRPTQAERHAEPFNQFRERLTQALPSDTGYEALKDRLLTVEVGSLTDIGERLDQQRKAALDKLIQEREQEAQDTLRRERALENYKTRQRDQEFSP